MNKVVEVVVEVKESTTTPPIELEMMMKILMEEGATLMDLKTSYNVLDIKSKVCTLQAWMSNEIPKWTK